MASFGSDHNDPPTPEQIATLKDAAVRKLFACDLGAGFGPFIMGYVFNLIMLGILFGQVWHWYRWNKEERHFIKILVWIAAICSLASSTFTVCWFVHLFVDDYGRYAQFVDSAWFSWIPIIDQPVITACHLFNLDRAYKLNGNNRWVLVVIGPFILATTAATIARKAVGGSSDFHAAKVVKPYTYTFFDCIVMSDILLTASIAWGLWKCKTGWKHTDAFIKRLVGYTLETQLLPSIAALSMAAQYAIDSETRMAFLYMIAHAKIPAVMLLAMLNYRFSLRKDQNIHHFSTTELDRQAAVFNGGHVVNAVNCGGFQADRDNIPMMPFTTHHQMKSHDWQPPAAGKDQGGRF